MRLARLLAPQVAALPLCVKKWFLRALQIRLCAKCFNVVKHLKRAEMQSFEFGVEGVKARKRQRNVVPVDETRNA